MPKFSESSPLQLPVRLSDRVFMERDGEAPLEASVSDLLAANQLSQREVRLSYLDPANASLATMAWGTAEPAGTIRFSPTADHVFLSGIPAYWANSTSRWALDGSSPRLLRVRTAGTKVALGWVCLTSAAEKFHVFVDSKPVTAGAAMSAGVVTAAGSIYWLTITLPTDATKRSREVEVLFSGASALIGVNLEPGLSLPVDKPSLKIAFVTDSYGGGGGISAVDATPTRIAMLLRANFHTEFEGDSGFNTNGGNGLKFGAPVKVARVQAFNPTKVVFMSGVNDDPFAAGYQSSVTGTFNVYKAVAPTAGQIMIGPVATAANSTTGGTWRAKQSFTLKQLTDAFGGLYVDTTGLSASETVPPLYNSSTVYTKDQLVGNLGAIWRATGSGFSNRPPGVVNGTGSTWDMAGVIKLFGTGKVGATTGDGNRDTWLANDGAHYTLTGHDFASVQIAQHLVSVTSLDSNAAATQPQYSVSNADAIAGVRNGAVAGESRTLIDGPNQGVEVRWYVPSGASAPTWCWHIYPLSKYEG